MKQSTIIVLLIIGLINFQCDNSTRSSSNELSSTKNDSITIGKLIGEPLISIKQKESELGSNLKFEKIESYIFDIDNNGFNDEILIERIMDWNDPGDFHRIVINLNKRHFSFFNSHGWVKTRDYEMQFNKKLSSTNLLKSSYVTIQQVSSNEVVLISFGYTYASQPGLLSIINLTNTPCLIFNDNYYLYSLNEGDSNEGGNITVTKYDKNEIGSHKETTISFKFKNGWLVPLIN